MQRAVLSVFLFVIVLCAAADFATAQEAGNAAYGNQPRKNSGVHLGNLAMTEPIGAVTTYFIEANVLMNVKADSYMAVFGASQEGVSVADSNQKLDARLSPFLAALEGLGVKRDDIFVDFITQNRIYDYGISGGTASEKLAGFELKKNIAVHYKDSALLEKMLAAAAKNSIFDLVKVDYVVGNMNRVRAALMEEAAKVIKQKEESYTKLLAIKLRPAGIFQEKYNAFYPSEMYNSYKAFETGNVVDYRANVNVLQRRKSSTFYFNPLNVGEFDSVVQAMGVEPMVQCTFYLKVKYTPVQ